MGKNAEEGLPCLWIPVRLDIDNRVVRCWARCCHDHCDRLPWLELACDGESLWAPDGLQT